VVTSDDIPAAERRPQATAPRRSPRLPDRCEA